MPLGKKYSKTEKKWVNVEKTRPVDYSDEEYYDLEAWQLFIGFIRLYPDIYLDILDAASDNIKTFELEPIQRIDIRAFLRYQKVFVTGPRGKTKTFTVVLSSMLTGIFFPGTTRAYYAPSMEQAAELAADAYNAIITRYPMLGEMWHVASEAKGSFRIYTDYGSDFSIKVRRGNNKHSVIAEECAQAEAGDAFDHEKFTQAVSATVRAKRLIGDEEDANFPFRQTLYITSAGTKQNPAYDYRNDIFKDMVAGEPVFCIDYTWEQVVLSGIQRFEYYMDLKKQNTAEAFLRECCGIWTGTSENPVIRDSVLAESRTLPIMEARHCGDPNVLYVIGYDVSYSDGAGNAKCATAVFKCTPQKHKLKQSQYLKELVYVCDNPPPADAVMQAKQIKQFWDRYSLPNSPNPTLVAIDSVQYGRSVLEALHQDLGDGLPPLCCMNHDRAELEIDGACPVIYPIRATSGITGTHDSDTEMLRYCEVEWEQRNVQILISNIYDGVTAYKRLHRIKDDATDGSISIPYRKTRELCGQIANLRKKQAGNCGMREERISKAIQRDMWSATKYAMRVISKLELEKRIANAGRTSEWQKVFDGKKTVNLTPNVRIKPRMNGRMGGNRI